MLPKGLIPAECQLVVPSTDEKPKSDDDKSNKCITVEEAKPIKLPQIISQPLLSVMGSGEPQIFRWKIILLVYTIAIYAITYQLISGLFGDNDFAQTLIVLSPSFILLVLLNVCYILLIRSQSECQKQLHESLGTLFYQFIFGHCIASFLRVVIILFDSIHNHEYFRSQFNSPFFELYALVSAFYFYSYFEIAVRCVALCEFIFYKSKQIPEEKKAAAEKPLTQNQVFVI